MVQIKFKAQGSNSLVGGFSHGDIARVGEALAKHLVEEAGVAEYVQAPAQAAVTEEEQPKKATRRGRA